AEADVTRGRFAARLFHLTGIHHLSAEADQLPRSVEVAFGRGGGKRDSEEQGTTEYRRFHDVPLPWVAGSCLSFLIRDFRYGPISAPGAVSTAQTVPSGRSFTARSPLPTSLMTVLLAKPGAGATRCFSGWSLRLGHPETPPLGRCPPLIAPPPGPCSGSPRGPCKSLDAPEDLPTEAPGQVARGQSTGMRNPANRPDTPRERAPRMRPKHTAKGPYEADGALRHQTKGGGRGGVEPVPQIPTPRVA